MRIFSFNYKYSRTGFQIQKLAERKYYKLPFAKTKKNRVLRTSITTKNIKTGKKNKTETAFLNIELDKKDYR